MNKASWPRTVDLDEWLDWDLEIRSAFHDYIEEITDGELKLTGEGHANVTSVTVASEYVRTVEWVTDAYGRIMVDSDTGEPLKGQRLYAVV